MKKVLKWVLIVLGGVLGVVVLAIGAVFGWINYQGAKTQDQKDSLIQIQNLSAPVRPGNFSEDYSDVPDVPPEIYDDRHLDKQSTAEVKEEDE